jgi:hypothetical protein
VVHLPNVVVVLREGGVPAVLHLLLAVHCRKDPGLVVVPVRVVRWQEVRGGK